MAGSGARTDSGASIRLSHARSQAAGRRLGELVPGGGHTYAKGADQYPEASPAMLSHGKGSHVWDLDGNEYIEYGMGLRAVALGHGYPDVVEAVKSSLDIGTNFTRPAHIELELAEILVDLIDSAEMVKFTKDGSTATTAALKLARKATGRSMVAVCADHAFFSYDDWFMATTTLDGGIPAAQRDLVVGFGYNDLESVRAVFARWPDSIAAVVLEPVRTDEPLPGFLEGLLQLCTENGAVLVFDEMITGFRYDLPGAQRRYGVEPHLSTWGKALANGFSVSALSGSRDLMQLGSRQRTNDDVFLLSATHGAEVCSLAAAIATVGVYKTEPVIEHLERQGARLSTGLSDLAAAHGLSGHIQPVGFPCNLMFSTRDAAGQPSQEFRTLFLQETIRRGVLMPSLVVSYSHSDDDIERTLEAIDGSMCVYARALEDGVERYLDGPPSRPVYERRWGSPDVDV